MIGKGSYTNERRRRRCWWLPKPVRNSSTHELWESETLRLMSSENQKLFDSWALRIRNSLTHELWETLKVYWNFEALFYIFLNTIFVSSHMYPENHEGTRIIVGSMKMGYVSDTISLPGIKLPTCSIWSERRFLRATVTGSGTHSPQVPWNILRILERVSKTLMCIRPETEGGICGLSHSPEVVSGPLILW